MLLVGLEVEDMLSVSLTICMGRGEGSGIAGGAEMCRGVFGGRGIGARGGRGDNGAPIKFMPLGESDGELTPIGIGRGLEGRPGLKSGIA